MKNIIASGIVALSIIFAAASYSVVHAQAATAFPLIEEVQTVSQCFLHGGDSVICFANDGMRYSYLGAAFVSPVVAGVGPAGPPGIQGIQGIPGPVQSFGSLKCPIGNSGSGGLTGGPNCIETTP